MKRRMITFALVLLSIEVFAQGISYIKVAKKNTTNLFEVEFFNDFKSLITRYKVNEIFFDNDYFIVDCGGKFFQFKREEFNNIEDYELGEKQGFTKGSEYYAALKYNISTYQSYKEFIDSYFINYEEFLDSKEKKIEPYTFHVRSIHGLYSISEIEKIKQYINWVDFLLHSEVSKLPKLFDRQEITNSTAYESYIIRATDKYYYISSNLFSEARGNKIVASNETQYEKIKATPALNYYISKIALQVDINNKYRTQSGSIIIETESLTSRMLESGYQNFSNFISGTSLGFLNSEDYELAKTIRATTYNEYIEYKPILLFNKKLMDEKKIKNTTEGYILYMIQNIPAKTIISFDKLSEDINKDISNRKLLRMYVQNSLNSINLAEYLKNPIYSSVANISFENKIIIRK